MKKYEFTGETMEFEGHTLRRIRLLQEFPFVYVGELGGWIESEDNLSHEGACRVMEEAKVFGNAKVSGNAIVSQNAIVKDNAQIMGESYISEYAIVGADTITTDGTWIVNTSKVFFYAEVTEKDTLKPNLSGAIRVLGNSSIEATGYIKDKIIKNKELFGSV